MRWLLDFPVFVRCVLVGAMLGGGVGGLVGLVVGLFAHWQTAWFAVIELGAPSTFLGAVTGAVAGLPVWLLTRRAGHR